MQMMIWIFIVSASFVQRGRRRRRSSHRFHLEVVIPVVSAIQYSPYIHINSLACALSPSGEEFAQIKLRIFDERDDKCSSPSKCTGTRGGIRVSMERAAWDDIWNIKINNLLPGYYQIFRNLEISQSLKFGWCLCFRQHWLSLHFGLSSISVPWFWLFSPKFVVK